MTTFSHLWTIGDFTHFYDNQHEHDHHPFIFSTNFSPTKKLESYLELCPKGVDETCKTQISIFLNLESTEPASDAMKITFKMAIVDVYGEHCRERGKFDIGKFFKKSKKYVFRFYLSCMNIVHWTTITMHNFK